MWIFKRVNAMQDFLTKNTETLPAIGFVPTMGALHNGHLSLMAECRKNAGISVCSIFVNPTQFNDKKDLQNYPRTIEADIRALCDAGCDVLFLPGVKDIYPKYPDTEDQASPSPTEDLLEGAFRPGHFAGVRQVLTRLFKIVQPTQVFFGQKDYQQCMVVKHLIETSPQFSNIAMNIVPTLREPDGLAMSSRNARLTDTERTRANQIYNTLLFLKQHLVPGNTEPIRSAAKDKLQKAGLTPEYVCIADAAALTPVDEWNGKTPVVALIAAYLGEVRLIDNMLLTEKASL